MKAALMREKRRALAEENPKLSVCEQVLADRIGVSEGSLVASGCGEGVIRLRHDVETQVCEWSRFGEVLAVTRNRVGLMEVYGVYPKGQFFEGLAWMEGTPINLSLKISRCVEGFYVPAQADRGASFQYFDGDGMAVHKLFFPCGREPEASFLKEQGHRNQKPDFEWARGSDREYCGDEVSEVEHERFMEKWQHLGDLNNFSRLMTQFGLTRLQAIRQAGEEHSQRLNREAVSKVFEGLGRGEIPVRVTMENRGVRHHRAGALPTPRIYGKWMNLLDPGFNLHLDESQINQVWRVGIPTRHGLTHGLEIFDKGDQPVLQLVSEEALRGREPDAWKELIHSCERLSIEDGSHA